MRKLGDTSHDNMDEAKGFSVKHACSVASIFASGVVAAFVAKMLWEKARGVKNPDVINKKIEKDKAKVVNSFDMEDIGGKGAFCRCWRSENFPFCDGSHNDHNKMTGDNVGPLLLKTKGI